mmetsp:Transcript_47607/g.123361  ORF Transcript_47607/g.123361 Transcript_47607/m.123361 type:complete len:221 (-) Transcript_47607:2437-3099(-)
MAFSPPTAVLRYPLRACPTPPTLVALLRVIITPSVPITVVPDPLTNPPLPRPSATTFDSPSFTLVSNVDTAFAVIISIMVSIGFNTLSMVTPSTPSAVVAWTKSPFKVVFAALSTYTFLPFTVRLPCVPASLMFTVRSVGDDSRLPKSTSPPKLTGPCMVVLTVSSIPKYSAVAFTLPIATCWTEPDWAASSTIEPLLLPFVMLSDVSSPLTVGTLAISW